MAKRGNNEGSIYKRKNGTWRAQISLEGKRLSFTANTRSECFDWLNKTQDQIDGGLTFSKSEYTVEKYLEEWIEVKKSSLRPNTALQYESLIRNDIIPHLGKYKLHRIKLQRINRFYCLLVEDGRGVRTIRLIHSVFHSALEHALRLGLVNKNPSHGAILPRKKYHEMKIYNEEQVFNFLLSAKESRFWLLYKLAFTTGMRQSELLGLKWGDIDWKNSTLKIQRQAQQVNGQGIIFLPPKTRSGIRQIVIGRSILREIADQKEQQDKYRLHRGKEWQDNNLIFATGNGTPFSQSNLMRDFYKVLDKSNLPKIRFHDIRHTAASLMINKGIPIVVVSKILGHSKPSVTLNIYSHCVSELQQEAAKVMEEITTPIEIEIAKTHSETRSQVRKI